MRDRLLEAFAASLACKAAVKMHEPLGPVELDVQFALTSGIVASTGTTTFNVVRDVTQV